MGTGKGPEIVHLKESSFTDCCSEMSFDPACRITDDALRRLSRRKCDCVKHFQHLFKVMTALLLHT